MPLDPDALARALALIEAARELGPDDADYLALERAVAHLTKSAKKKRRLARKQRKRAADRQTLAQTALARERAQAAAAGAGAAAAVDTGEAAELYNQLYCYVCKQPYREVHAYYHKMCRACGDLCLAKRDQRLDLSGRRALVTGGRTKIGFASALRLLRAGAEVVITTRFAADAGDRYLREADHRAWADRLSIVGLDFRQLVGLIAQVDSWARGEPFDIVINNAAQTVWHPPDYYRALVEREGRAFDGPARWLVSSSASALAPAAASDPQRTVAMATAASALFPAGADEFGNPIDLRRANSWVQRLGEVDAVEMVEAQLVNNVAPFIICNGLIENLARSRHADRYVINVSAVEGQFARGHKPYRHPHTNMAKAALNMLTRTSAEQLAERGIYMVSVDPGWMSHEGPAPMKARAAERGFHPPLTAADAAARLVDPIACGIAGEPRWGVLLKDYRVAPW